MATGSSKVASPNTELGEKDLAELLSVLYPARHRCIYFGLEVGLEGEEIEGVENRYQNADDRLRAILSVRLNKAKPLTWNEIDSALRSKMVDKSGLAEEIRRKYGHLFISAEREYDEDHEIKSKEILQVKESAPKMRKGSDHRARVRERSSEYEGIETVRSKKHVQEVESEDEEDGVLSRKERKELKGEKPARDKEQHEVQERFTKYESQSELEVVEGKASKETYHKTWSKPLRGETEYQGERENSSVTEKEKSEKRKGKANRLINFILRRKPKSQDDENSRRVKGKKLSKAAGAPSKDDSHGDKEESDAGGSRDQEDQPKETGEDRKNKETYHKTRSKPPRKETEGRDGKREVDSGMIAKKATAPPLERDLPSSEMAQTDSGDGESDESSEDENELEQQSSDEEEETENDSTAEEKEEKRSEKSRKSKEKATHPTTEMRKTKSQDDENSRSVKGKKLSKAAGAPSKDDSHGDKEESDAGGSRDQKDQPKKRNRRRHRESSKSPIVRGGSSPSSSQEERKPGSRRQRRTPNHGGKYKRKEKKKRRETSSRSSDTDSSSPESEMMKNLTKSEKKKLKKVFKYSFGQLCSASFNPVETAVQLQKKGLISQGMVMDIIRSPESQQEKIIRLVRGLDNRIRSRPERLFGCIEVLLEIDALQEVGRKMLRQTGKPFTHQAQSMFVMCISSSLQV